MLRTIKAYVKTANIKFISSRTYSARRISWYSASTDVEQLREHCRPCIHVGMQPLRAR
jgi:hypothetical protein